MATATSEVEICNLASDHISAGIVTSIEKPNTEQERLSARWYDTVRRATLRKLPWNFAKKRVILARNAVAPEFGYTDAYDLPNDELRLLTINEIAVDGDVRMDYEIEGKQILINNEGGPLKIIYIFDQKNVAAFDPLFVDLFALELAVRMAYKITGKQTKIEQLRTDIERTTSFAASIDGQERPPRSVQRSKFLGARKRLGSPNYTRYDI